MRPTSIFRSLALFTLSLVHFALSHSSHSSTGDHLSNHEGPPSDPVFERFHERHDLETPNAIDESENYTRIEKRGAIRVAYRTNVENANLYNAYQDMLYLVEFVYNNWKEIDPYILDTYFHPFHLPRVKKVAAMILQMARQGGVVDIAPNLQVFKPTDFNQIVLLREHGVGTLLAEAFEVGSRQNDPKIVIYDFGWQVLKNRRFLSDFPADCSKIGSKVDYRMQFLGGLIFHEVL